MRGLSGQQLLRRPVRLRGIELGRAFDLVLDPVGERVLGFDVLCGDGAHRFLPISAAEARPGEITIRSPLTLLDPAQLAFYREHGTTLTELRAAAVEDVVLADDGVVAELVQKRDGDGAAV
jgi:hypothetical protein